MPGGERRDPFTVPYGSFAELLPCLHSRRSTLLL